eukprot:15325_5
MPSSSLCVIASTMMGSIGLRIRTQLGIICLRSSMLLIGCGIFNMAKSLMSLLWRSNSVGRRFFQRSSTISCRYFGSGRNRPTGFCIVSLHSLFREVLCSTVKVRHRLRWVSFLAQSSKHICDKNLATFAVFPR